MFGRTLRTLNGEAVTVDVEDAAGNVLFSDLDRNFDISTVASDENLQTGRRRTGRPVVQPVRDCRGFEAGANTGVAIDTTSTDPAWTDHTSELADGADVRTDEWIEDATSALEAGGYKVSQNYDDLNDQLTNDTSTLDEEE